MDNWGPIVAAALSAIVGPLLLRIVQRRKRQNAPATIDPFKALRDERDLWEAHAQVWKERYEEEQRELAREKDARDADRAFAMSDKTMLVERLRDTQHDLDDCERQKDNAYAELRGIGRRRNPRGGRGMTRETDK